MKVTHTHACPIAAALNVIGDRWTLLIIREAFYGAVRFGEIRRNTGISRNILSDRLNSLVADGILEKVKYADRGTSYVYHLSEKGRALETVLGALLQWGNEYIYGEGAEPVQLVEKASQRPIKAFAPVDSEGRVVARQDVTFNAGPGANNATRKRLADAAEAGAIS